MSARDPELERLCAALAGLGLEDVELAFVLGSGLGAFAERLGGARRVPYEALDGMPRSTVPGHAGALVLGELAGTRVLVQQGRAHLYEGRAPREVSRAVRAFARLGCRVVVLTNAAGGLVRDWPAGTLMRVRDHLNLQGATPLETAEMGAGAVYDAALGAALERGAREAGVELRSGVYAGLRGPSYETPAEVALLRSIGADAVGMSTVLEALAARAEGARVAAVSLISNPAAGSTAAPLSHAEVVAAGREAAGRFCALLESSAPHLLSAASS